ncbi:MAG: hypothetical protein BWY68_00405 [bacterium ADurb.Bin400]|nr:MAG: hypothetical protein BWY68_00405 [bacterium ADurb.Bin400]
MWFGLILVLLGVLLLLQNLGILPADAWGIFWPVIIIAFGLSLLIRAARKQ